MSRLPVALDGRRLQDQPLGGVGRSLLRMVERIGTELDLHVLVERGRPVPPLADCEVVPLRRTIGPEPVWLHTRAAGWLARHPMLFHGPYNAVPVPCRVPTVVTIHDLSWEHHPVDFPSRSRRESFRWQARWAATHARQVVTVSEFVREALRQEYRLTGEKVTVLPNAADPVFAGRRPGDAAGTLARLGISTPYLVALGGASRRRLGVAVQAWRQVRSERSPELSLVVVGRENPGSEPGLHYVGQLDDESWAGVLAAAVAFCYPTTYEGFGMPALEAAAAGTAVVAAPVASLPEVLGPAGLWCEPTVSGYAAAVTNLLDDDELRQRHITEGRRRADDWPSYDDCARMLLEVYRRASEG